MGRPDGTTGGGCILTPDFVIPPGFRIRGYYWVIPLRGILISMFGIILSMTIPKFNYLRCVCRQANPPTGVIVASLREK
jgi:hypothetical protein